MNGKNRKETIREVRGVLECFKDPNYKVMAEQLIKHADGMEEHLRILDILLKGSDHPVNREDVEQLLGVLDG